MNTSLKINNDTLRERNKDDINLEGFALETLNNLVVAIDFDGTISTEPHMGKELKLHPYCKEVLTELRKEGVTFILWTCRTGKYLDEAVKFLAENEMFHLFTTVNNQLPEIEELYHPDVARKVGADFYYDDRNLGTEINWLRFKQQILNELEA